MADTQITILGMTGAGKTCYLLSLYYKMSSGMNGYTITTKEDEDVKLRQRYLQMCDPSKGKERFPAGTDRVSEFTFDLECGYKTIMSFDWLDYPGGILDIKNESIDEYEKLKKAINSSSTLFICVGGELLVGNDTEEKIEKVRDQCSAVINTFFSNYFETNNQLPPTAIIVTKYDICSKDTNEEELYEIIKEAFSPLFVSDGNQRIVTVIPVSIGKNIMDEEYSGKLKPMNVHLPIFMGIWFALSKKIQNCAGEFEKEERETALEIDKLKKEKRKMENKWIFKSKSEIQRLAKAIEQTESKYKEMKDLLDAMKNNSEKIEGELKKIPCVYINGERSSFSTILNK